MTSPYLEPEIYAYLKESDLIFDTDAIVNIIKFQSFDILEKLSFVNAKFSYINQVFLELMATNVLTERTRRLTLLSQYHFQPLTHIMAKMPDLTAELQIELHKIDCHPSPTDLYLGACLINFSTGTNTLLLTANIKDFPSPIFEKVGFLILEGDKQVQALTLIKFNGYNKTLKTIKNNEIPL